MNIIMLSGGSGKRLWPLSNEVRSKQFLKIFKLPDGSHESMVQRMYREIRSVDPGAEVTFATSETQVVSIRSQLGDEPGISVEPCRRDTFPAIALAACYLSEVKHVGPDEPVVVCPVDPYVEEDYFRSLEKLSSLAGADPETNLYLMGIEPTFPAERYGYIIPRSEDPVSEVLTFREKPDVETAKRYLSEGALWNSGVFAFRLFYLLRRAHELIDFTDYRDLLRKYESLKKISFDYAVVEHEEKIKVLRFHGVWKDLGTWNTLTEAMADPVSGNAVAGECGNTHVINELQIPLVALGCRNLAIAATPDGILVTDKDESYKLKDYVADSSPRYEKRFWGEYRVLDCRKNENGENSLTKELVIQPGRHISYQRHLHRTEMWTFTEGEGTLILNGEVRKVSRGSFACVPALAMHGLQASPDSPLRLIEVQIGDELTEEDIERFDWPLVR